MTPAKKLVNDVPVTEIKWSTSENLNRILNDLAEGIDPHASVSSLQRALQLCADQRDAHFVEMQRLKTSMAGIALLVSLHPPQEKCK